VARRPLGDTDIPGNAMGSQAAYVRQMLRQSEALLGFEDDVRRLDEADMFILTVSVRFPHGDRSEYLAVVRVDGAGGRRVGFHNAPTYLETLVGVVNRLKNGSMRFKEDVYAEGN